jgi:nitrate reductase beta subunit
MLDPHDPEVLAAARAEGIPEDWLVAAQNSPVYKLAKVYKIALPLHPEYRTMPMVWYVPPLSPIVDVLTETGHDGEDAGNLFGAINALRIPLAYLAELFTAGDTELVESTLRKLSAMRSYMRDINLGHEPRPEIPEAVGMDQESIYEMYRLLAIAKYEDRYVIPAAHAEQAKDLENLGAASGCSLDGVDLGPNSGPFGQASGNPVPVTIENFHIMKDRQTK